MMTHISFFRSSQTKDMLDLQTGLLRLDTNRFISLSLPRFCARRQLYSKTPEIGYYLFLWNSWVFWQIQFCYFGRKLLNQWRMILAVLTYLCIRWPMVLRYNHTPSVLPSVCVHAHGMALSADILVTDAFTKRSPTLIFKGNQAFVGDIKKRVSCCDFSIQLLLCVLTSALPSHNESR
jgi:hypothetical protein